jgi:stage II sporulation SpoAA-like protein
VPVTYQFDREFPLIRTRCGGDVTFAEVVSHFRELERDACLPARLDVLLDLTEMRSIPESDQLRSVAGEVEHLQQRVRWGSCAIVASRDVLFGMSRVFQVFAEAHFANSKVFRDLDDAERWLASVRSPP